MSALDKNPLNPLTIWMTQKKLYTFLWMKTKMHKKEYRAQSKYTCHKLLAVAHAKKKRIVCVLIYLRQRWLIKNKNEVFRCVDRCVCARVLFLLIWWTNLLWKGGQRGEAKVKKTKTAHFNVQNYVWIFKHLCQAAASFGWCMPLVIYWLAPTTTTVAVFVLFHA